MKILDHIKLAENKLAILNTAKADAEKVGDLSRIILLDVEILETTNTLAALRSLV